MNILLQRMLDVEHIYYTSTYVFIQIYLFLYMFASELHKLCHPAIPDGRTWSKTILEPAGTYLFTRCIYYASRKDNKVQQLKTYVFGEPDPGSGQSGRTSSQMWSPGWCICICKRHTKRIVFVYSVFVFLRIMQIDLCRDYHGLSVCIKPWDPYGPTGANMTSRITMHCYDGDDD